MNVLVTGATGFIGAHLCQELMRQGEQVTALVRPASAYRQLEQWGVRLLFGDLMQSPLREPPAEEFQLVVHLAGLVKALDARDLFHVNEWGTRSLLESIQTWGTPPVTVVVSSLAAVGPSGEVPHIESATARPVSNYGRSKRQAEIAAESFAERIPISIVRPPIVFGEGDRGTLPIFQAIARTRVHAIPGIRPKRYSLIHVADLVQFLISVARDGERLPTRQEHEQAGQGYYFVDGGDPIRFGHFGLIIGKALGYRWTLRLPVPHACVWGIGAATQSVGWLRGAATAMSIDKAREATAGSWMCSSEKAQRQLGYAVSVPLAERIRQTAVWYRENRWL